MTRICTQDRAHALHTVGKQRKRRSLLDGVYNLNSQADKRCYYLHFPDGDQDTPIWCAKGHRRTWRGQGGSEPSAEAGLPGCPPRDHSSSLLPLQSQQPSGFPPFPDRRTWQAASSRAAPAPVLPSELISAKRCRVRLYSGSICYCRAPRKICRFCLADVVLTHIGQLFLCFNIMIWKLFALDVYSCCWV